jgi:hypothetical protein
MYYMNVTCCLNIFHMNAPISTSLPPKKDGKVERICPGWGFILSCSRLVGQNVRKSDQKSVRHHPENSRPEVPGILDGSLNNRNNFPCENTVHSCNCRI